MKTVLFCGGQGLRIREHADSVPKPMVQIGYRPILWHLMKYYPHFGHNEFVLALGHKADVIKRYFLEYDEALSNDFSLSNGGKGVELKSTDIQDWEITFADTGIHANIGQRLKAVRNYVGDDEIFLANYGDLLTDAPLDELLEEFEATGKIAAFLTVRPTHTFHIVTMKDEHRVAGLYDAATADLWINAGFFMFRREIFDYIYDGEELVEQPFARLAEEDQLLAYRYEGFWAPMDTLKDRQRLEEIYQQGMPPWAVWQRENERGGEASLAGLLR